MKKKGIIIVLVLMLLGQTGFADWQNPPNVELSENQEVFYQMTPEENMQIRDIDGMAYYPEEDAVYIRMMMDYRGDIFLRTVSKLPQLENNTIVVKRQGIDTSMNLEFDQGGLVYDFEVDQGKGYQLIEVVGPCLRDAAGSVVAISGPEAPQYNFEFFGNQIAYIGVPYFVNIGFHFAIIPEVFDLQMPAFDLRTPDSGLRMLNFDRVLPFGDIEPIAFDFSADGKSMIVFGEDMSNRFQKVSFEPDMQGRLYIEQLTIPTEPNFMVPPSDHGVGLLPEQSISEGFKFEVKADGFGDEPQNLRVRDMYTTEDNIVVLFHKFSPESLKREVVEPGKTFIQRYTYEGELIDQLETNYFTEGIAPGPKGSTLYVQKRFIEQKEGTEAQFKFIVENPWQLEIIQMNWEKKTAGSDGMHSVIAERTFGGRTLARFTDKGFGLLKQVEEETGIVDYRAPLKAKTNDVRLQIPYNDLLAKAGSGVRNLMLSYQGQEIAIPFGLLLSAAIDEMPCQDDATIEIHLQVDEEGNVTVTIDLFVVEQVNAMTKVVHRKTIQ